MDVPDDMADIGTRSSREQLHAYNIQLGMRTYPLSNCMVNWPVSASVGQLDPKVCIWARTGLQQNHLVASRLSHYRAQVTLQKNRIVNGSLVVVMTRYSVNQALMKVIDLLSAALYTSVCYSILN
jgi:hypothetical protein